MLRPTPGDPWGVEQQHWDTGAEENQQLNPGYQKIGSKTTKKKWRHHFPHYKHYKSMGVFFRCSRADNFVVCGPIWPKFKSVQDNTHVLVTYKFKMDRINSNREKGVTSII